MKISEILESQHITIKSLSDEFQIPYRTVQDWAAGRRSPPEYLPSMIAELLENRKTANHDVD